MLSRNWELYVVKNGTVRHSSCLLIRKKKISSSLITCVQVKASMCVWVYPYPHYWTTSKMLMTPLHDPFEYRLLWHDAACIFEEVRTPAATCDRLASRSQDFLLIWEENCSGQYTASYRVTASTGHEMMPRPHITSRPPLTHSWIQLLRAINTTAQCPRDQAAEVSMFSAITSSILEQ